MKGLNGLDLKAIGIPSMEQAVTYYANRLQFHSGHASSIDAKTMLQRMDYYIAFSLFRSAAILQGVYKR